MNFKFMFPLRRIRNPQLNRLISSLKTFKDVEIPKIRNIGILAHIDAGKTTTTERFLYYSGLISHMGEVHHGNTVTDYMTQERERGITITSAAVTFYWRNHQFNLIDTPGHIDFTMEVEQSLSVLDGAICILDASAGVEAQTLTVWRQADRYDIPRLIFLNKLDRGDADVNMCLKSIEEKLDVTPICLQLPIKKEGKITALVDILSMEQLTFSNTKYEAVPLTQSENPDIWNEAIMLRSKVVDKISEFNGVLAEKVINEDSMDHVKTIDVVEALKQETEKKKIVPVLIGSAYKNIGIQPLMDSIIMYLPSPRSKGEIFRYFENNLCAKSFKIQHSKQRGTLVYVRLYNGSLSKGQKIHSVTQNKNEQIGRIYTVFADDLFEVESIKNGNIGVITGLKHTKMGDLISNSSSTIQKAEEKLMKSKKSKSDPYINEFSNMFGFPVKIPEPVFFCSIETQSISQQSALENALFELQREDPSLSVTQNHESGQTVLGGMGELHLEIIKDRILRDYKIDVDLGQLQINYHEALLDKFTDTLEFSTKIGNSEQKFTITLSVIPKSGEIKEKLIFDKTTEAAKNLATIYHKHILAIKNGVDVALLQGPRLGCKVSNVQVMLHFFSVGKGTSETVIAAGTTQLVQKMIKEIGTDILEPVMSVEVVTPEEYLSTILADLSRRRAVIQGINIRGRTKVVMTQTPLSELLGYSTILRTISSGTATFAMEFLKYKGMSPIEEEKAIKSVRGF